MRRRLVVLTLPLAWVCVACAVVALGEPAFAALFQPPAPPPALVFDYKGWRVNAAATARVQSPQKTVVAIEHQLDIVEQVRLKPDVLAVMRAVPIQAVPGEGPNVGLYASDHGVVVLVRKLDPAKPVVLRCLLDAYYQQRLAPPAAAAADIAKFRGEILTRRAWPKSAAMLRDDHDFFAFTAAAYLNGAITREPYNRANLRKTQPGYYQWLARLFDDGRARR